jgi:hypothetical protein
MLIGRGDAILYADASTSAAALPDSRARWEAIWRHRAELEAIVHSHPVGPAAFSSEDESTMAAIDSALGRAVRYCIVAPAVTIARTGIDAPSEKLDPQPWWAALIRLASGMRKGE